MGSSTLRGPRNVAMTCGEFQTAQGEPEWPPPWMWWGASSTCGWNYGFGPGDLGGRFLAVDVNSLGRLAMEAVGTHQFEPSTEIAAIGAGRPS